MTQTMGPFGYAPPSPVHTRLNISDTVQTIYNIVPNVKHVHWHPPFQTPLNFKMDLHKVEVPTSINGLRCKLLRRPRWLSWMRHPTGDQEVMGSTAAEVGNILSWRLIVKYFLLSFSPFCWFKKGSCQFLSKECAQYWLTAYIED